MTVSYTAEKDTDIVTENIFNTVRHAYCQG